MMPDRSKKLYHWCLWMLHSLILIPLSHRLRIERFGHWKCHQIRSYEVL
jgi:hypothetical protein